MAQNLAINPAEIIIEELGARGWDPLRVAIAMEGDTYQNMLALYLYLIVKPQKIRMGDAMRIGLSKAFGVSEEFFACLEAAWLDSLENRHDDYEAPNDPS